MTAVRTFEDNATEARIEMRIDGDLVGWVEYRPAGESVILAHTEVLPGHEGQGLGGSLVSESMRRLTQDGSLVLPMCPFALKYLRRHPELHMLVDASMLAQVTGS